MKEMESPQRKSITSINNRKPFAGQMVAQGSLENYVHKQKVTWKNSPGGRPGDFTAFWGSLSGGSGNSEQSPASEWKSRNGNEEG